MNTEHHSIPGGDAGTRATLRLMAELARAGGLESRVRNAAADAVLDTTNPIERIEALAAWIQHFTQFLPDPVHAEALVPAAVSVDKIQSRGLFQGDCDDVAVLAAAMGMSIGLRARFAAVAFHAPEAPFAHVWAELSPAEFDEWVIIDPTRPGQAMPYIARRMLYVI